MKILVSTWAWKSHFFPLVPFAWAARAAGHEVRVASQPALSDAITGSGLTARPVGRDTDERILYRHEDPSITLLEPATSHPDHEWSENERFKWHIMKRVFCGIAECMVDGLVEEAERWQPDLIVSDQTTFAATVAEQVTGVPHARLLYGPDITGPRGRDVEHRLRPPEFEQLFRRFGVEPPYDLARWTIDPCPTEMQTPTDVDRVPMRHIPYNGGMEVPQEVPMRPERPRVCVTWGTTQLALADERTVKVPLMLEALAGLDVEALVIGAGPYRHLLRDVPSNARVFDWLPLDQVISSCSAVIHQGGSGTALVAADAAVPQLMIPQVADQGIHAERLAATGAGHVANIGSLRSGEIRSKVTELIGDTSYREAAQNLREQIRKMPTPAEVVRDLEDRVCS